MRHPLAVIVLLLGVACAAPAASGRAGLVEAPPIDLARAEELGRDGARVLLAEPEVRGPEGTDLRRARVMAVREGDAFHLPPAPSLVGALLGRGVVWVTVDGLLLLDDGAQVRTLDHDVIPELALSPDGARLAYAKRPGEDAGVYVWDGTTRVHVTEGLEIADRPLFVDDDRLVVVGSVPSGVAGVWIATLDGQPPTPVTNATLRTGRPLDEAFVPPPADHRSMRLDAGVLVYFDGRGETRVVLP